MPTIYFKSYMNLIILKYVYTFPIAVLHNVYLTVALAS